MNAEFSVAVHAMVYLAAHCQASVNSSELASNICTNPARVRKVMSKLCKASLVVSTKGQGSGYASIAEARRTDLAVIAKAIDEVPVEDIWQSGDLDRDCLVCSGMGSVMDDICHGMNLVAFDYLKKVTIGSICDRLLQKR